MYDKNRHTKSHTNVWKKPACKCMKKNKHTNIWKKHAYKCMKKTRIQTRIRMYDKNTHTNTYTNLWQKHAYKCMNKNRHKNVWKKYTHILEWWTANYSTQGIWDALLKGTAAVTRRWTATRPAVCPPIILLSSEWGLNHQPSGYWTTTLTTAPRPTRIQM